MKLKFEFINEDTGQKVVVKNKDTSVFYHDSDIHDTNEYEELTGKVLSLSKEQREIINTFYKLSGILLQ